MKLILAVVALVALAIRWYLGTDHYARAYKKLFDPKNWDCRD